MSAYSLLFALQPPSVLVWVGASGTRYHFRMAPIGTSFLGMPGLYVFAHHGPTGWVADYIGKTRHFYVRIDRDLRSHNCWPRIVAAGSTHIGTFVVQDSFERTRFETDLIRGVQPSCNR